VTSTRKPKSAQAKPAGSSSTTGLAAAIDEIPAPSKPNNVPKANEILGSFSVDLMNISSWM